MKSEEAEQAALTAAAVEENCLDTSGYLRTRISRKLLEKTSYSIKVGSGIKLVPFNGANN